MRRLAALEGGRAREFHAAVEAEPGVSIAGVARRLGITASAASLIADQLCKAGLLEKTTVVTRTGRQVRLTARPAPGIN